jgi:hypothetical protein
MILDPQGTNRFIDSAFLATLFETGAMTLLYLAWRSITESELSEPSTLTRFD